MVGAEAAIIGAAVLGAGLDFQRPVARLHPVPLRLPVAQIVADQSLLDAVLPTTLLVEDVGALCDDLSGDQGQAGLTQAGGLA